MARYTDSISRFRDVVVAVVGLVALAPVFAVTAIAVRIKLGSPVLFRQRRIGRGGVPFTLLKFRSMADAKPGRDGPEYDGERLGAFGATLRATSMDELPSLWNLARGEISLVGPRPLPVQYWDRYRGHEYERFAVRPGITGLAQINGRNETTWEHRLDLDVQYVRNRSVKGDLAILARTAPVVLGRGGINNADAATMLELPADRPMPSAVA